MNNPEYAAAKHILSKTEDRKYMRFLKVFNGQAIATNGKVLLAFNTSLTNGFYFPTIITKKQTTWEKVDTDLDYPEYESLLPSNVGELLLDGIHPEHITAKIAIESGVALSSEWVKIYKCLEITSYACTSNKHPVIFFGGCFTLVVMPFVL